MERVKGGVNVMFWYGWICGAAAVWLQRWLWRRLRCNKQAKVGRPRCQAVPLSATQREWAMTRNFLYYDGTTMPEIHTYKEEQDE